MRPRIGHAVPRSYRGTTGGGAGSGKIVAPAQSWAIPEPEVSMAPECRLEVIGPAVRADGVTRVPCRCKCGAEKLVRAAELRYGKVRSCGCLRRELARAKAGNRRRGIEHQGQARSIKEWAGRLGISPDTISARFRCGCAVAEALSPSRLGSRLIGFAGEALPLRGRARELGISRHALRRRFEEWPLEKALTLAPLRRGLVPRAR